MNTKASQFRVLSGCSNTPSEFSIKHRWTPKTSFAIFQKRVLNSPGTAVCTQGISIHPFTLFVWPLVASPWQPCQRLKNNSLLTLYVATCCYCRNPIVYAIQPKMRECALHVRVASEWFKRSWSTIFICGSAFTSPYSYILHEPLFSAGLSAGWSMCALHAWLKWHSPVITAFCTQASMNALQKYEGLFP